MLEMLERAALMALGAAALTQKKGEELVEELKTRYKMSEDEGRAFLERIQEMAQSGKERGVEAGEAEMKRFLDRIGVVQRDEFEALKRRMDVLEAILPPEEPGPEC